ncbi:hypothetical protein BGW80DRAFT_1456336 [Lactifluus volemus]|nr:hypothetical protein BGW80DRAFT_1456336 [Lactifluus volemus]
MPWVQAWHPSTIEECDGELQSGSASGWETSLGPKCDIPCITEEVESKGESPSDGASGQDTYSRPVRSMHNVAEEEEESEEESPSDEEKEEKPGDGTNSQDTPPRHTHSIPSIAEEEESEEELPGDGTNGQDIPPRHTHSIPTILEEEESEGELPSGLAGSHWQDTCPSHTRDIPRVTEQEVEDKYKDEKDKEMPSTGEGMGQQSDDEGAVDSPRPAQCLLQDLCRSIIPADPTLPTLADHTLDLI